MKILKHKRHQTRNQIKQKIIHFIETNIYFFCSVFMTSNYLFNIFVKVVHEASLNHTGEGKKWFISVYSINLVTKCFLFIWMTKKEKQEKYFLQILCGYTALWYMSFLCNINTTKDICFKQKIKIKAMIFKRWFYLFIYLFIFEYIIFMIDKI